MNTNDQEPTLHRIHLSPTHFMVGEIVNDEIHVHDIVDKGQSEMSMTGERPALTPIPLAELTQRGFAFWIEDAKPGDGEP